MTRETDPVVITLKWDNDTHDRLTQYRNQYFPAHANHLQAHLTLFHAIPAHDFFDGQGEAVLRQLCSKQKRFNFTYGEPTLRGRAVFLRLFANPLMAFHHALLDAYSQDTEKLVHLTEQDQKPLHPHITVTNKGNAEDAQRVYDAIVESFRDHASAKKQIDGKSHEEASNHGKGKHRRLRGQASGVDVWRYRGGPWEHCFTVPFREPRSSSAK